MIRLTFLAWQANLSVEAREAMPARLLSERATERRSALWAESGVRRQELWTSTILPVVRNRPLLRRLLSTTITHLQDKNARESLNSGMKKKIVLAAETGNISPEGQESHVEAVVVTPEQAWSIAENLPLYERTLVITEAATGCRISECLALKWLDIEWEKSLIRVQRAWVRGRIGRTVRGQ